MRKSPATDIGMAVKIKIMAKDMAKGYYTKKVMKKDKKFTRNELSKLINRFHHFTGGPYKLVNKLMNYYRD